MAGNPENFGGGSGEDALNDEQKRLEDDLGKKATGTLGNEVEAQSGEREVRDKIARVMTSKVNMDRFGNTISEESLARLQDEVVRLLDGKSPDEVLQSYDEQIRALMERGEKERAEWNTVANSKTEEEREVMYAQIVLTDSDLRRAMREAEMVGILKMDEEDMGPVSMKLVGYFDKPAGEAENNEKKDEVEPEPEPKIEPEEKPEASKDGQETEKTVPEELMVSLLDVNAPDYKEAFLKRRIEVGDIVRKSESLNPQWRLLMGSLLWENLKEAERREQQMMDQSMRSGFEMTPLGEIGTVDEVVKAATAAAVPSRGWFGKSKAKNEAKKKEVIEDTPEEKQRKREYRKALSDWAKETTPGRLDPEVAEIYAEEQRKNEYYNKLHQWAEEESKSQKKNRFGDPELTVEEREKHVGNVFNKLVGRILRHGSGDKKTKSKNEHVNEVEPIKENVNYSGLSAALKELLLGSSE